MSTHFGLWYDLRNPADPAGTTRSFTTLYRQVLDQMVWAESLGIDSVWLTEHHFMDDGYTPSPFVIAGAIGERTERLRVGTNLIVSPLHNPIRLAEDAATLSLLTDGRFDLGVGQGYWEPEFAAFGRSVRNRPSLLEEGVEIIRRCWSGSDEGFTGRRLSKPALAVSPTPESVPALLVGAMADPAIERAARIADGFLSTQNVHHAPYVAAMDRLGRRSAARIYAGQWVIIADDPEAEWARIGRHALYQINKYIDRAVQVHGSLGYSADLPLEFMYRAARAARLYDGPDEVHRDSVARQYLKGYAPPAGEIPTEHIPTRRTAATERFAELLAEQP